jgi:hypothetical protein
LNEEQENNDQKNLDEIVDGILDWLEENDDQLVNINPNDEYMFGE